MKYTEPQNIADQRLAAVWEKAAKAMDKVVRKLYREESDDHK